MYLSQEAWCWKAVAMWVATLSLGVLLFACGTDDKEPAAAETAASPAVLAQGESLYAANCARCHGFGTGGSITDIPPPHNANGHTWHHPDQQLTDIVLNGLDFAVEGQQTMPAFKGQLTPEQVQAILAYIKTWWTGEQRSYQATVTATEAERADSGK